MEGLIPLVFKSLKRNKTLKQYNSLGGNVELHKIINIEDFYPEGYNYTYPSHREEKVRGNGMQTRHMSLKYGDHDHDHERRVGGGFSMTPDTHSNIARSNRQLVRFRSHRLFSCVTGA